MGTILIPDDPYCYECGKTQKKMRGFNTTDGCYVTYCKTCVNSKERLKHLRNKND